MVNSLKYSKKKKNLRWNNLESISIVQSKIAKNNLRWNNLEQPRIVQGRIAKNNIR
jgi:hypothetical protein